MKYLILAFFSTIILFSACKDDVVESMEPFSDSVYIEDNIFGCDQFETMEIDGTFFVNAEPALEVFNQFFVYGTTKNLVIKDGFNGPTLQSIEMNVNDLVVFENQLMICANEGVYSLRPSGEVVTVSDNTCYSMTLDGQNRLMLQGSFGSLQTNSAYDIIEYKNNTLVVFTNYPYSFSCLSLELTSGEDESMLAISCDSEIALYENGTVQLEFSEEELPFFSASSGWSLISDYHNDGFIVINQSPSNFYRMHKLVNQVWRPIYHLDYDFESTEKNWELFIGMDFNIFIHNDYLYAFSSSGPQDRRGIGRFDISGDEEKTLEDIELIEIPGLKSRDIYDIVRASDGHAYAVLRSKKIVRLTC